MPTIVIRSSPLLRLFLCLCVWFRQLSVDFSLPSVLPVWTCLLYTSYEFSFIGGELSRKNIGVGDITLCDAIVFGNFESESSSFLPVEQTGAAVAEQHHRHGRAGRAVWGRGRRCHGWKIQKKDPAGQAECRTGPGWKAGRHELTVRSGEASCRGESPFCFLP